MKRIEVVVWAKDVVCKSHICEVLQSSPAIAVVSQPSSSEHAIVSEAGALTPAEKRVLRAFLKYDGAKEVAAALGVSYATVKKHLERIYDKLGVRSLHRALVRAISLRLIEADDISQKRYSSNTT